MDSCLAAPPPRALARIHPVCPVALQGFIDGIGPLASMPRFLSVLGVQVLRSVPLRQMANQVCPQRMPPPPLLAKAPDGAFTSQPTGQCFAAGALLPPGL